MIPVPNPRVFVVSGPSGVGKTTIIRRILLANPDVHLSVSSTTREPRPGEIHGQDYFFIDRGLFEEIIKGEEFLEWAVVYGHYYGTSYHHVMSILQHGYHALLDIDSQGATRIQQLTSGVVFILIAPPSLEHLERRLRERGSESEESLQRRLAWAEHELSFRKLYDYVIVNDQIDQAVAQFQRILDEERPRPVKFVYKPGK